MEAEKWGRRIRAFRKLKGYTQEGFAKELGVSVSVYSRESAFTSLSCRA
ncbi:helix-turn-helix domain-containing protein [Escherichia sp. TWPC-MK]